MSTITNCEKCIFADYSDSPEPCAMGIIDRVKELKTINVGGTNFNKINQYRCAFAFSADVYKNNLSETVSVESLKEQLYIRAAVDYYMVILLKDLSVLDDICKTLSTMLIKPKFVSLVTEQNNHTESILEKLKINMPENIKWKLHNFLDNYNFQETMDTIFETNTHKTNITYFWINDTDSINTWDKDISKINDTIVIEQPFLHAMFRKNQDGLFLTFNNYQQILNIYKTDILTALEEKIENKSILYYG
jgi:hypothetical protein